TFGPPTLTTPFSTATFPPAGMATGCLPIRDTFLSSGFAGRRVRIGAVYGTRPRRPRSTDSPHRTQNLAAPLVFLGLAVGHPALARRENGDAEAVEHAPDFLVALVNPPPGLGVSLDVADALLTVRAILREHLENCFVPARGGG